MAGVVKTWAPPSRCVISAVTFPVGAAVPLAAATVAWIGTGWVNLIDPYTGPSTVTVVGVATRGLAAGVAPVCVAPMVSPIARAARPVTANAARPNGVIRRLRRRRRGAIDTRTPYRTWLGASVRGDAPKK